MANEFDLGAGFDLTDDEIRAAVSRRAISSPGDKTRYKVLRFPTPDWAVVRNAASVTIAHGVFTVMILGLLVGLSVKLASDPSFPWIAAGCVVAGVACVAVFWYGQCRPSLRIDRSLGTIEGRGLARENINSSRVLYPRDVVAVQICAQEATGSADAVLVTVVSEYVAYEVNLVFREPPGGRLTAHVRGRRDQANALAEKLSTFLSVPLLDHAAITDP